MSGVRRRWLILILLGQMLYSAGSAITSGSFLTYYVRLWTSSAATIAWFLILPELVHVSSLLTQRVVRHVGSVKRVWLGAAVVARLLAVGLALIGLVDPDASDGSMLVGVFALLAVAEALRAISYAAFVAWISALFGKAHVGRLFGYREFGIVLASMLLPPVAAVIREFLASAPETHEATSYSIVFLAADGLVFAGLGVLALLPDVELQRKEEEAQREPVFGIIRRLLGDPPLRRVLATSIHLAAAQGLTQSVFFKYQVDVLQVPLSMSVLLTTTMLAVQLPLSVAAGYWLDRYDNRRVYSVGLVLVALAMPCWFLTAIDTRWIWMAFVCWGAFAIVNVSGRSSVIRLVDAANVPTAIAIFRFGAGLVAAISGLVGGYWLDSALDGHGVIAALGPYFTILAVSAVGRVTAPLWLFGWTDDRLVPRSRPSSHGRGDGAAD